MLLGDIVESVAKITNIHGRYDFAMALLEGEVHRILEAKDWAKNYERVEWTADSPSNCVEFQDMGFKKLIICLVSGKTIDISKMVDSDSKDISCVVPDVKVRIEGGIIFIEANENISAVRGLYKPPYDSEHNWLVNEHSHVLISFLRWQMLADIDARSANVAYLTYTRQLKHLESLPTI